ncbi:MAG: PQQ-binding-like beta-propeller repeat protein [Rickettsiales bacterium]|jgi:outer membrane protein assembly factor BamB
MSRRSFYSRYSSTFCFFPVFLPLVELLPWFLALLGLLAGGVHFLGKLIWKRKIFRFITLFISVGLFSAAGWLVWQRFVDRPIESIGSELEKTLPELEILSIQRSKFPAMKNIKPLTQLWKIVTPYDNLGKPVVHDGVLFSGSMDSTFDAFDAADGHRLWTLHKREPVFTPPTIAGGRVFIGEGHHTSPSCGLTSLSLDGTPQWSRLFRSHLESQPMVDALNNRLWQAGGATGLWALSMDKGEKIWWQQLGHMDVPPLYSDGRLFVVAKLKEDADGVAVFEMNPDNGNIKWKTPLEGNTMGSIWRDGKRIYLSTAIGQVGVLESTDSGWVYGLTFDGTVEWKTKLPSMPLPEGAISDDGELLFYTLKDGSIIALHTNNGDIVWREKIGDEIQTDIALIDEEGVSLVVAIAKDGNVSIRESLTGNEYTHFTVESGDSNPIYAGGILYIVTPTTISAYAGFGRN